MIRLINVTALSLFVAATACLPMQEATVFAGDVELPSNCGPHFAEFHNDAPMVAKLPVKPRVGCFMEYAAIGAGDLTFDAGPNLIKWASGQPENKLTFGPATHKTGHLTFNGKHWVHVGG